MDRHICVFDIINKGKNVDPTLSFSSEIAR